MSTMAEHEQLDFISAAILAVIFGAVGFVIYFSFFKRSTEQDEDEAEENTADKHDKADEVQAKNGTAGKQLKKTVSGQKKKTVKDLGASHPLLLASLKGHTGAVAGVDVSSNGKLVATCSEDRSVRLWNVKDFAQKDHKYTRINVEYDYPSCISVSPDSRAFIVGLGTEHLIRVFKIHKTKKDDGSVQTSCSFEFDFPKEHKQELIAVGISSTGKFIMSADKGTQVVIWTTKGDILDRIDTLLIYNSYVCISPCGNLVAACGFTPDVKFWHIGFNKSNEFTQVTKTLGLKGHSDRVLSFSFTNDSKRIVTISKDQTWKVWDVDVEFLKGQDAYLIHTGSFGYEDDLPYHVALSPDYFTVAISFGHSIQLFNANTQALEETLQAIHQADICALLWLADSKQLVSSGGCDKSIRVWHNVPGVKANLVDLTGRLPKAKSDTTRERIQQQIDEAKEYLLRFSE